MLVKVISNSNGTSKEEVERFPTLKTSVTRLGNLLDLGNFLKLLATINSPKSPTF